MVVGSRKVAKAVAATGCHSTTPSTTFTKQMFGKSIKNKSKIKRKTKKRKVHSIILIVMHLDLMTMRKLKDC